MIAINDGNEITVINNTIINNTSSVSPTDTSGIFVASGNHIIFSNKAQGQGTGGANNYVGVNNVNTWNPSTGAFGTTPTPFDNISATLP